MRRGLFWAAAFLTALLHAGDLMAAIASKRDGVRPEMTWNPRPEQDDILLPMPCGLKMALRAVAVPVGGLLQDRRFFMGIGATDDDRRQIYERRFPSHIAAPFSIRRKPCAALPTGITRRILVCKRTSRPGKRPARTGRRGTPAPCSDPTMS